VCMRRIEMDDVRELVRLHRMKSGAREVARLLRISPNTERQYRRALEAADLLAGAPNDLPPIETLKAAIERHLPKKIAPQQVSSLERWTAKVQAFVDAGLGPRAIYDRLRLEDADFRKAKATVSSMKRLCRRLKVAKGVRPEDVAIPVETEPGKVAQVDFGYVGKLFDPQTQTLRKAWVFVMVLGYSRHMYAQIVFDQTVETWLWLHAEAFKALGGVVETVVPDNLKAAVIRAAFGVDGGTALNRSYRDFARHYGFKIDPTPVYAPKKKGKVESQVKYVKGNFFTGRGGDDAVEVQAELDRWVVEIAGEREHGTTGKRPLRVFRDVEQAALLPLPTIRFEPVVWKEARVHQDSHVAFEKRLYSVPWRFVGKTVWLRATKATVAAYFDDTRIATHVRGGPGLRSTLDEHLPEHRADLRHRSQAYWEDRADRLGPEVGAYVREVFASDDVLSMLRSVQAIVTHLEGFPVERARAACRRASFYGTYGYRGLKNILVRALDLEPLPVAAAPTNSPQESFRFARSATELLNLPLEITDEPN